jgi:hypothetical protein
MRGCDIKCDMSDQIGRNDQTRTRATETLIKQTERRQWFNPLLELILATGMAAQVQRQDLPDLPPLMSPLSHLYLPLVTPLSQTTPWTMVT